MPSSTYKSLTRKKKAVKQFRRGSKTFRHKKNLRQKISVKKLYRKDKRKGKRFTRVARGFVNVFRNKVNDGNPQGFAERFRNSINLANQLEETDTIQDILNNIILSIERKEREEINETKETECPLCMDTMSVDKATKLNCGHKFHTTCLINNLIIGNHYTCPMCRRPMFDDQLEDNIKYVLSDTPEEGLERAMAMAAWVAEWAAARSAAERAIEGNADTEEELVYITNMVVELAKLRVARKAVKTPEAWAAVVEAAGARIDEMARTEAARVAAARTEAEREAARTAAMASQEAARTEASRLAIVAAARARIQAERAAEARRA